jgi:hypothetical protein
MGLDEVIDELYSFFPIRRDEYLEGMHLTRKLEEYDRRVYLNTPLDEYDDITLLRLYERFITDNTTILYDKWYNAIKMELLKRIKNNK